MAATATYLKPAEGFLGDAAVYRLDPPLEDGTVYVVASAVDLPSVVGIVPGYRTSETMCFPSNADGRVRDWGELGFAPYKDHAAALEDMGYEVTR